VSLVLLDSVCELAPNVRELLVALLTPEEATLEAALDEDLRLLLGAAVIGSALIAHDHDAGLVVEIPRDGLTGRVNPPVVAGLEGSDGVGIIVEFGRDCGAWVGPDFDAIGEGTVDGIVDVFHVRQLVERVGSFVDEDTVQVNILVLVRLPLSVVVGIVLNLRDGAVGEASAKVSIDVGVGVAVQLGNTTSIIRVRRILARTRTRVDDNVELSGRVGGQRAIDLIPGTFDRPGVEWQINSKIRVWRDTFSDRRSRCKKGRGGRKDNVSHEHFVRS
jgi:hypothetical protein